MEKTDFSFHRTGKKKATFSGEELAKEDGDWQRGFRERRAIYRVKYGYMCRKICESQWLKHDGRATDDLHIVKLCKTKQEVISFFGYSDEAKYLYSQAGIEYDLKSRVDYCKKRLDKIRKKDEHCYSMSEVSDLQCEIHSIKDIADIRLELCKKRVDSEAEIEKAESLAAHCQTIFDSRL